MKILRARGNPTKSYIIVYHASATRICGKSDCTPASGFASHVEDQHVVVVRPFQLEIAITRIDAGILQCYLRIAKGGKILILRYISIML